jgi:DnaJ-class molecular chaperone
MIDQLNVNANVPTSEIKSSYRQLSRILHPDKLSKYSPEMQETLTEQYVGIQAAHEALKNPTMRYVYDR